LLGAREKMAAHVPVAEIEAWAMDQLSQAPLRAEYFSLVDGHTLQPVRLPKEHRNIVACTAVWAGQVRLIDNLVVKGKLN
ncbi:MAG: pantoate--beta-alanine ligase, partial [Lewinella sp.]|nr:pantoate--beta-alanine ligase [Lewinella sp.]